MALAGNPLAIVRALFGTAHGTADAITGVEVADWAVVLPRAVTTDDYGTA